jgi:hypothetical protein
MHVNSFVRASDKQIEAAGRDAEAAKRRMMDWHFHMDHGDGHRLALGDFAVVPGKPWTHAMAAWSRGLHEDTPLNGGEVGASATLAAVGEGEALSLRGVHLLRHASNRLLAACIQGDPRKLPQDPAAARAALAQDRQYAPTGYLAVADVAVDLRGNAKIDVTQVGDVFVALDTGGRVPRVLQGSLEQRAYAGETILGEDKAIDMLKAELKGWIAAKYPHVSDQFFYDLIFNGTFRPQFIPTGVGDVETFKRIVTAELCAYACAKYAAQGLTPGIFDAMIENGMTPWQQNVAQNNPAAGPFWYPALDAVGDVPEHGVRLVRLELDDVLRGSPVRLTMWTDGSRPAAATGIALGNLEGVNAYGEQTRLEYNSK